MRLREKLVLRVRGHPLIHDKLALVSFTVVLFILTARTDIVTSEVWAAPSSKRALLIYMSCNLSKQRVFRYWNSPIPTYKLVCDPVTNAVDCNEAVPYLNFVIDHYDDPSTDKWIFIHGHHRAWHYQSEILRSVDVLVKSRYFKTHSYGGVFAGVYSKGAWADYNNGWAPELYDYIFQGTSMPPAPVDKTIVRPCCGTFWVDRERVRGRPRSDYVLMRDRLRMWSKENKNVEFGPAYYCGRIMEYFWHLVLGGQLEIDVCDECLMGKDPNKTGKYTRKVKKK